jgi:hypothetical protein
MKAAVSYFRFDTVAPILAEATRNRASRVPVNPGASLNISDDMGFEINANIGWSPVPAFRIQPFVSVFIPLDGTTDINRLFLDSNNDRTAYLGGVEFRAQF